LIRLPYNFEPRDYQIPILSALDGGFKRVLWCVHRRAGKDLTVWNWVIKALATRKGICYYIFPTYSQAKKVIWNSQTKDGKSFLSFIPKELIAKKSEQDLSIFFKNGSFLQLVGSDNTDRIMGTAPSICVFSEAALQQSTAWNLVRPILTENDGVAIFISTPRGKNWFYDLYNMAKTNPLWYCERLSIEDTKAISKEVVEEELKAGMSEELVRQEFYVDFTGLVGSYYITLIDKMRLESRIGYVACDPSARVHTAWDLGIGDATAIIFFQVIGNEVHVIDSYEACGESLAHYANVLDKRGYLYGIHYAPHDIENRELATGLSRKDVARNLGVKFVTLPTLKVKFEDGIEITRGLCPRVWSDETKCLRRLKALENCRKEYDDNHETYKDKPVHDQFSHYADAYRYMSIAVKLLGRGEMGEAFEKHKNIVDNRRFRI